MIVTNEITKIVKKSKVTNQYQARRTVFLNLLFTS